jgi:lambda family phage tail tape measure protein
MADLRYRVELDTRAAQQNLSSLRSSIAGFGAAIAGAFSFREFTRVSAQLDDLRRSLQTLYRDSTVGGQVFKEVGQLANEFGVDINTLAEAVIKLKAAGIDPTTDRLRLFASVSKSSIDSIGALQAITDLFTRTMAGGLGLEDLERLQDRGIPVYDILAKKLGLARNQLSEFGQTAKGAEVIRSALEEGLRETFGDAVIQRANSLSTAMTNLSNNFKLAVDDVAQAGLSQVITDIANTLGQWISANKDLIVQIGQGIAGALRTFLNNIDVVIAGLKIFLGALIAIKTVDFVKTIAGMVTGFANLAKTLSRNPLTFIALGAAVAAQQMGLLDPVIKKLTETFSGFDGEVQKIGEELGTLNNNAGTGIITSGNLAGGIRDFRGEVEGLNQGLKKFRAEMDGVSESYTRYNQERINALNLETQLIGATNEEKRIRQEQAEITKRATEEIAKLTQQKAKLTEQEIKEGRGDIIDQTIAKIEQQAEADKQATAEAIANSEARQRSRQVELFGIQSQIDLQEELYSIQDEIAKLTMTEIEKKYYDIEAAAKRAARAAIAAEEARIGRPLSIEEQRRYYDEASKGVDELKQKTREQYDESRQFSTGWKQAMNEYVENATNGAKMAKDVFTKATQSMEDAIVNFAKTGKFEFKSFMSSILEDLLRSQIRQIMGQIFNFGASSGAGATTGSFLGNLLGFANGGVIPTNNPVIVGERGPELISGAAGRVVTPNNQLGGNVVNYNISAVDAASFKALVAADPAFIHAVATQGSKSIPGRR